MRHKWRWPLVPEAQVIEEHPLIRIGLVFSGRQSPRGHNVVWGIYDAMKAQHPQSVLLGFLGGFDLLGRTVDQICTTEQVNATMSTCCDFNLDGLVIIGGIMNSEAIVVTSRQGPIKVTSNSDAAQLVENFADHSCKTKVVGVPVSLNANLKNQFVEANLGFDTVCKVV